ncbi:MAG: hypothetical protein KDK05_23085, partial [Candidatus Competibacteraceae bacterium]|nr:hypothetical protein [Candidatus Competibacteraceae bacterium]
MAISWRLFGGFNCYLSNVWSLFGIGITYISLFTNMAAHGILRAGCCKATIVLIQGVNNRKGLLFY